MYTLQFGWKETDYDKLAAGRLVHSATMCDSYDLTFMIVVWLVILLSVVPKLLEGYSLTGIRWNIGE